MKLTSLINIQENGKNDYYLRLNHDTQNLYCGTYFDFIRALKFKYLCITKFKEGNNLREFRDHFVKYFLTFKYCSFLYFK